MRRHHSGQGTWFPSSHTLCGQGHQGSASQESFIAPEENLTPAFLNCSFSRLTVAFSVVTPFAVLRALRILLTVGVRRLYVTLISSQ